MNHFVTSEELARALDTQRAQRLTENPVMQCKVCWYLYRPEDGCQETETPPGTPFSALPEYWCCPRCASPRDSFLPVTEGDAL